MRGTAVAAVSDVLDARYVGNSLRAWLIAVAIFVVTLGLLVLVRRLIVRRLAVTAPITATQVDDVALGAARRTSTLFLAVIALSMARAGLDIAAKYDRRIDVLARLAFCFQGVSWGNGAIAFWIARVRAKRASHDKAALTSINLLGVVAQVTLWVVLVLLALDAMGVNITALVTGLGVAGVAVALAVQNVLGDLLASLAIALDKPFVVGDFIIVDQYQGTVENVGLKTTRIRSISGEQIVIANAELLKARIRNYQGQLERRVVFTLALDPDTPADAVAAVPALVREVVSAIPATRLDRSHFSSITDSALVVETVYFVLSGDYTQYMDIQQRINLELLTRLRGRQVRLAFSGRETVLFKPNGAGGDRARRLDGTGGRDAPDHPDRTEPAAAE